MLNIDKNDILGPNKVDKIKLEQIITLAKCSCEFGPIMAR